MSENTSPAKQNWFKLDNAAKIYPPQLSMSGWMALFRLSANLTETVDNEVLQSALERVIKRFPSMAMRLRRGLFWFYGEKLSEPPRVSNDALNPCARMNFRRNGGYMFRVRSWKNRIAVEYFHALADGTGGLCFLKTLLAEYISLKYGVDIPRGDDIFDCDEEPSPEECEDSFIKYARKTAMNPFERNAYHMHGTPETHDFMNVITALIPSKELVEKAHSYKATVTEYLSAHMLAALLEYRKSDPHPGKKPIKINIPVNLRKFYGSKTVRNFSNYINLEIMPTLGEYEFSEILGIVRNQLALFATEKNLNAKITMNVTIERNIMLRIVPLLFKIPALKMAFKKQGDILYTTTLSNLGNVKLPAPMNEYITRFDFLLGSFDVNPTVASCVSYGGITALNITRSIKEADFEKIFMRRLVRDGLHVKIESNSHAGI